MQSLLCLALGGSLLGAASLTSVRMRALTATLGLTALLAAASLLPIPINRFIMGDGSSTIQDRSDFEDIVRPEREVRFSAHLAYRLLDRIDRALGSTQASPAQAYRMLSWLAGALFAISLAGLAAAERWTPRSVRYIALSVSAPATLMYFGYIEVGYLALSAAAFPLAARDLHKGDLTAGVLVASLMFGLGAAFHGIGYLGIAGLCAAVLASHTPIGRRIVLTTSVGAIAVGAALIWLWYYLAVLGFDVTPHHSVGGFIPRPLWDSRVAEEGLPDPRIIHPLLSMNAARDLILSGFVAGVPVLLVALLAMRTQWSPESRPALAFTLPSLTAFLLFWPVQGIAIEMDMIVAGFPALYPLLWICSRSVRASIASVALLAVGQWIFWYVVLDPRFINHILE